MPYRFDFSALTSYIGLFLHGALVTLALTGGATVLGLAVAVAGAAFRRAALAWLRGLIACYVELVRNTPFIVQLFFVFFGLPSLGLRLSAPAAAILALGANLGAYGIEIVRAGLASVPGGQREAALALGLRPLAVFRKVVLPQALANVFPALASQIVITMLESAVVSQIAVRDLTYEADLVQSRTFRAFETYLVVTAIYLGLAVLLRRTLFLGRRGLFAGRPAW